MQVSEHAVVIAGGGPTGLMLAGELRLAGVDVAIVERRSTGDVLGSRAGGLHARTLELLDQRGIADRFLVEGQKVQVTGFAGVQLDISDFPTRHPYTLGLWQNHIERLLGNWVGEQGVPIYRGTAVVAFSEDESGLAVELADGRSIRATYLVGCDGGRSTVRKLAGIAFPGTEPTSSNLIAQVELAAKPAQWGVRRDALGIHSIAPVAYEIVDGQIVYKDEGPIGVLVTEASPHATGEPTLDDLRRAMVVAFGTDYGAHSPLSISRFTDATRQAETYRKGRVLVAGDAAHIHPPDGGQGLQTGVQDAVNLGWKLAQVVRGISPEALLDTYHAERHPVGVRVLRNTLAAVSLRREDDRSKALRSIFADLLGMDEPRRAFAAMLSGLDIRYDMGEGHPLLGRRVPDLDIETSRGKTALYTLLHAGRPLLIRFDTADCTAVDAWEDRVDSIAASYHGHWELPLIGSIEAPAAILVRPDGYVAWVGRGTTEALAEALERWCGPPSR